MMDKGPLDNKEEWIVEVDGQTDYVKDFTARLSEDGKVRGLECSENFPGHYHPGSGSRTGVHVQTKDAYVEAVKKNLSDGALSIIGPYTLAASNDPNVSEGDVVAAFAWDVAATIDPFFITDLISWWYGIEEPEN